METPAALPLPRLVGATTAVPAPGVGDGWWAGAPSAAVDPGGGLVVAYRVRNGHDGVDQTVVARTADGERLSPVVVLDQDRFGATWMQRPALVRTGDDRWRLFVCCGEPTTKRWWVEALEADDLEGLGEAEPRRIDLGEEGFGVKDPVVRVDEAGRWRMWVCCHPLDVPGAEDRMSTGLATSANGWTWRWEGTVMTGRSDRWDARGARLTCVLPDGWATYDGRASAAENWFERTGVARLDAGSGRFEAVGDNALVDVRYLEVLALPGGGHRVWYEARLPDLSHELRTERLPGSYS